MIGRQDGTAAPASVVAEAAAKTIGPRSMHTAAHSLMQRATAPPGDASPTPRCVLLFAHPDDETLALGARLARFGEACLVHVTDGSPREGSDARALGLTRDQYRVTRFAELAAALKHAGVFPMRRECFGIPDQQAALGLASLTDDVHALLRRERPEVVFTHPYEGGHPDHDATAFAVQAAVHRLRAAGEPRPLVVEAMFYHAGSEGIETGCFLSPPSLSEEEAGTAEIAYSLSPSEQQHKRELLHCFHTQADTLRYFTVEQERFRPAPVYDFTHPPHSGRAFYDNFSWGMTSSRFCELAAEALRTLPFHSEAVCR